MVKCPCILHLYMSCVFPLHFVYYHGGWMPGQRVKNVVILRKNVFFRPPKSSYRSQKSEGGKNGKNIRQKLGFRTSIPLFKEEVRRKKSAKQKKVKEKGWFSAPLYWLVESRSLEVGKQETEI